MRTLPISEETEKRIALLFAPKDQAIARVMLVNECGHNLNLPGQDDPERSDTERVRFAVLKLSKGRLDKLERAVRMAKIDYRDALISAGFGEPGKHESWMPRSRSTPTSLSRLLGWFRQNR